MYITGQGLPLLYIVLISASAGSLMIVAVVVIFCICKKCRKSGQKGKQLFCLNINIIVNLSF